MIQFFIVNQKHEVESVTLLIQFFLVNEKIQSLHPNVHTIHAK